MLSSESMGKLLNFWPPLIILLVAGLFFYRLFFPPSIFVTPDFGLSDTLNQNFAFRVTLHEALQQGIFPWWNEKVGMGFPLLAEGQVGALNLFNLVLTYFFPPWLSFNLTYVLAFLIIGIFTYLLAQQIGLSKFASLLSAVVLMFSGPLMGHMIHLNLLLTFAYFPVELWLAEKIVAAGLGSTESPRSAPANLERRPPSCAKASAGRQGSQLLWWALLALVINQQILAGHLQLAVYSLLVLTAYFVFRLFTLGRTLTLTTATTRYLFYFLLAMSLAIVLSLPQLLPSFELAKQSGRSGNLPIEELTRFPFLLKNLLSFLNPNWFGNPEQGGYGKGDQEWGLWWENTAYIGLAPLLLVVVSIFYLLLMIFPLRKFLISNFKFLNKFKIQNSKFGQPGPHLIFFAFLALIGVLLSLGVYGPFFWAYQFPPLSLFRVPARWLFFVVFALAMLAGFGISLIRHIRPIKVLPKTVLFLGILLLSLFDLWFYFYNHNPIGKVDEWLVPPSTVEFIKNYDPDYQNYRVYDLGTTILWDKYFWQEGFSGEKLARFKNLRNGLTSNLASIWGIESADVYAGVKPLNLAKLQYLLTQHQSFELDPEALYQVSFDDLGVRILSSQNIKYIVTPLKINQKQGDTFLLEVSREEFPEFAIRVYENLQVWPRFYFVENIQENFTLPILDSDFIIRTSESQAGKVTLEVENPKDGFLVWSQSFYPGWKAEAGGVKKEIYQYNINQMAVFLRKGRHRVEFRFGL